MKKWSIITVLVMALLTMVVMPVSALAQADEDVAVNSNSVIRDGLAIVAPRVTPVDTRISITVFQCWDQEPVEGAGVWLITKDKLEAVRQDMLHEIDTELEAALKFAKESPFPEKEELLRDVYSD